MTLCTRSGNQAPQPTVLVAINKSKSTLYYGTEGVFILMVGVTSSHALYHVLYCTVLYCVVICRHLRVYHDIVDSRAPPPSPHPDYTSFRSFSFSCSCPRVLSRTRSRRRCHIPPPLVQHVQRVCTGAALPACRRHPLPVDRITAAGDALYFHVSVSVCMCILMKLHITAQPGPVILVIRCH